MAMQIDDRQVAGYNSKRRLYYWDCHCGYQKISSPSQGSMKAVEALIPTIAPSWNNKMVEAFEIESSWCCCLHLCQGANMHGCNDLNQKAKFALFALHLCINHEVDCPCSCTSKCCLWGCENLSSTRVKSPLDGLSRLCELVLMATDS